MGRGARLLDPPSKHQTVSGMPHKRESNAVFRISKAAGVQSGSFLCLFL